MREAVNALRQMNTMTTVRVRFAPSPTDTFTSAGQEPLCLTGYLLDETTELILRIEDTDVERSSRNAQGF
jgi:glutamyl/glutaminyl-tRNA synthetase